MLGAQQEKNQKNFRGREKVFVLLEERILELFQLKVFPKCFKMTDLIAQIFQQSAERSTYDEDTRISTRILKINSCDHDHF